MQANLFTQQQNEQLLQDLFKAYSVARKNKRNTINALSFEKSFESKLFSLNEQNIQEKDKQ